MYILILVVVLIIYVNIFICNCYRFWVMFFVNFYFFYCVLGEINRFIKEKEVDLEKFERIKEDL